MPGNYDAPARRTGTFYVEESFDAAGLPQTPTDPVWRPYSSVVTTTEPSPEKEFGLRQGLGSMDPTDKNQALENNELTVEYELERFPVDGSGNSIDPIADTGVLDVDNAIGASHSFYQYVLLSEVPINSTVHTKWFNRDDVSDTDHPTGTNPNASAIETRKVMYGRGGLPEEGVLGINADDNALCTVEFTYRFVKIRPYQFDQPSTEYLHVYSTDSSDTGLDVTIESAPAADGSSPSQSDTLSTDATDPTATGVTTTATYDSLGTVHVPGDNDGAILVYGDDGSGSGSAGQPAQLLAVVKGNNYYDDIEGDTGTPPVGSGSFDEDGTTLESKQYAIGAEVFWNGIDFAQYHQGSSITIGFDISEEATTNQGLSHVYGASGRTVEAETTAFGSTVSEDLFADFVEGRDGELTYSLTNGDVVLPFAHINEGGPGAREDGEAFVMPEVTFVGKRDTTNNREAIEFNRA